MNRGFSLTKIAEIFKKLFLIFLFILPAFCMYYVDCVMPITSHEIFIPYGKSIFQPEHGRYVASFLYNFLFEKLPVILNVHVADLRTTWIAVVAIFSSVVIIAVISYGVILFSNKENKLKINYWIIFYLLTFFILFNTRTEIFLHRDLIEFFEYPCSLIAYLPFLCMVFCFFVKDKLPSDMEYVLFLILAFFTGITLEQINIPALLFLSSITLIVGIEYLKSKDNLFLKQKLKVFSVALLVNCISFVLYYVHSSDHIPVDKYMTLFGSLGFFREITKRVILDYWIAYVFMALGMIAILLSKKQEGHKLILSIIINTISLFIYYYIVCYGIFCFYDVTNLLENCKYFLMLLCILIFQNFVLWGYFFNTNVVNFKPSKHVYLSLAVIYLSLFFYLYKDLTPLKNFLEYHRQRQYYFEKCLIQEAWKKDIVVPNFEAGNIDRNLLYSLFILHYPDFEEVKTVVMDKNFILEDVMDKEEISKGKLKFSNFPKHRIMKYKGEYFFSIEKVKEDENYAYYEIVK